MKLKVFMIMSVIGMSLAHDEISVNLGKSIVSASRVDTPINEAPGNVSVVTQKEINLRPNYKFSDTLRGFEGLQQSKSRGMDTFDGVKIRGLSGAAVMIDGIMLNDINNNTKMLTAMSADDIEQVEVVRGAFSNIYGSGAVAGAINFITTMPTSFETRASFGYGSALGTEFAPKNTFRGYVSVGDAFLEKKLRVKLSFGTTNSQGYAADSVVVSNVNGYEGGKPTLNSNTGKLRYNIGDMGNQAYQIYDSALKAEYDIGDVGTLSGYLRWNMYSYDHKNQRTFLTQNGNPSYGDNQEVDINNGRPAPILYGRHIGKEMYHQLVSAVGYKHYLPNDSHIEVKFSRIDGWDKFNNPDGGANPQNANTSINGGVGSQTNHRYQTNNLDLLYLANVSENHRILSGVQYRHNNYTQTLDYIANWKDFNSTSQGRATSGYAQGGKSANVGVFSEWQGNFFESLSTNIGVRYDFWQGYDVYKDTDVYAKNTKHNLSPKISLNYALSDTTRLKSSFGQAFKAPTLSQMFSNRALSDGTFIKGNPHLKPENVISFDVGFEWDIVLGEDYGAFKMYYFNNTITNAIMQYSRDYADVNLRGMYDNLGKNRIQGIESSLMLPLGYGLSVHLTYTFMDSKILKSIESNTQGNKVAGIPAHMAYGALNYDKEAFYGSFGVEYASKPYKNAMNTLTPSGVYGATDSYIIADLRLGWRINKNLDISSNITNLFNHAYYSYYRASGRAFFVSLAGRF